MDKNYDCERVKDDGGMQRPIQPPPPLSSSSSSFYAHRVLSSSLYAMGGDT
jgi:hypothetical protein